MNPNGIKKNDYILVTRENGETWFGRAVKVAPWTKNPKITVVNYHYKDANGDEYKVTADARKCVLAPTDMHPKAPEVAPLDPCMAGWELGKTQRGPMMMEGHYYHVMVLFNGKRVGKIIDEGNGGPTMTGHFNDRTLEKVFNDNCTTWAKNNGADMNYLEAASEFWAWWDEYRPKGKDAKTYFKEQKEEFAKMFGKQTPIITGDLALVEGKV